MADNPNRVQPESTEFLFKKLCFIIAEKNQGKPILFLNLL